jgi:23S rRNA G2069 N7-methylase RlmK/C1962 C5-methylase RlmI
LCRCSFIVAKVEDYLKTAATSAEPLWDVIVLDPPKLAPSRKHLKAAANKYTSLNTDAMRMLKPGGLLMTCSCSGAVAQGPTGALQRVHAERCDGAPAARSMLAV